MHCIRQCRVSSRDGYRQPSLIFFDTSNTLYRSQALDRRLSSAPADFLSINQGISIANAKVLINQQTEICGSKSAAIIQLGFENSDFQSFIARLPVNDILAPDVEMNRALRELKEHFRMGIITNLGSALLKKVLKQIEVPPTWFQIVVTADDVDTPKPSKEPFLLAIEKSRLRPADCWYVGDSIEKDLSPAKEVGMRTVLVNSAPQQNLVHVDYSYPDISSFAAAMLKE